MGGNRFARRLLLLVVVFGATLGLATPARAAGTLLMLEGSAGASAPTYTDGAPGWTAGVAFGPTLRPGRSPLRFHLLGNIQARRTAFTGGLGTARARADLVCFLSQRTVLPITYPLRIYLETGLGLRQAWVQLPSGATLSELEPLLALAVGAQLRWTRDWSFGLRAGWEPALAGASALDLGRERAPDATLTLTLGAHF